MHSANGSFFMIAQNIMRQTVVSHHNPSSKARHEVYQVAQANDYEYMASTPTTVPGSPNVVPADPPAPINPHAACFNKIVLTKTTGLVSNLLVSYLFDLFLGKRFQKKVFLMVPPNGYSRPCQGEKDS